MKMSKMQTRQSAQNDGSKARAPRVKTRIKAGWMVRMRWIESRRVSVGA